MHTVPCVFCVCSAGCLGVNLVGASRVVVFDASWNPCHDCQAICRVYRYGQTRSCHIYRLVSDNTMEKKIYNRQISKQGVSDRIVDEMNTRTLLERRQIDVLLQYEVLIRLLRTMLMTTAILFMLNTEYTYTALCTKCILMVSVTVQNLVWISAIVSIICKF